MKNFMTLLSLSLLFTVLTTTSVFALIANHPYTIQLNTVSETGQALMVDQTQITTDANGKLNFRFENVPDSDGTSYLMVQIMDNDNVTGQPQMVRQTLVPAPKTGQQMQMGINEISHRQTQATLQAMMQPVTGNAALKAMFPLTMISTGALSDSDTQNLGMMVEVGSSAFEDYLTQANVGAAQMTTFNTELMVAMRDLSATYQLAVDANDQQIAAGYQGQATAGFMQAMLDAGAAAGIDPELLTAAFDQAHLAMENATEAQALSMAGYAMFSSGQMIGHQQLQGQSQMLNYAAAMGMFNTDAGQVQTFIDARAALQQAMLQARQDYQQIFSDPANMPDQATIDQAQAAFTATMQTAMDTFAAATMATNVQIDSMLGQMATRMSGSMMGGGMMGGIDLMNMGFGQFQMVPGGTTQNWSTMMLAGGTAAETYPQMSYMPLTNDLMLQLQAAPNLPVEPDWSTLPDDANRSLLQLQYDLMLAGMIDHEMLANATIPLSAQDQILINETHMLNQTAIQQGIQGLTAAQAKALVNAMAPLHVF